MFDEHASDSVHLGDARLSRRFGLIVDRMRIDPAATLPSLLGDGAELDAAYRAARSAWSPSW